MVSAVSQRGFFWNKKHESPSPGLPFQALSEGLTSAVNWSAEQTPDGVPLMFSLDSAGNQLAERRKELQEWHQDRKHFFNIINLA